LIKSDSKDTDIAVKKNQLKMNAFLFNFLFIKASWKKNNVSWFTQKY